MASFANQRSHISLQANTSVFLCGLFSSVLFSRCSYDFPLSERIPQFALPARSCSPQSSLCCALHPRGTIIEQREVSICINHEHPESCSEPVVSTGASIKSWSLPSLFCDNLFCKLEVWSIESTFNFIGKKVPQPFKKHGLFQIFELSPMVYNFGRYTGPGPLPGLVAPLPVSPYFLFLSQLSTWKTSGDVLSA